MKNIRDLYIFAHKGEAQSFLRGWRAKKILSSKQINSYQTENNFILITGEGIQQAIISTIIFLNAFKKNIQSIKNLGIAASLNETISLNKVYSIRTVLAESLDGHTNSFQSNETISQIKLISTLNRVLNEDYAKKFRPYADIVDMELWGIAKAAEKFKIPFYSYKIISDIAGKVSNCNDIKKMAMKFSQSLFDFIEKVEK